MAVMVNEDPYKSVVVIDADGNDLRIDEGMNIKFANLDGEEVSGQLSKISGKGEKVKILITPPNSQKQEIWRLADISEGSLSIVE